mmetsp:Transcript_82432/g.176579  ORF Transcript_82432/g.176579 Transcript_82432/m.176579 type:complete len:216 (+) Transcript_82432:604-1251(+)
MLEPDPAVDDVGVVPCTACAASKVLVLWDRMRFPFQKAPPESLTLPPPLQTGSFRDERRRSNQERRPAPDWPFLSGSASAAIIIMGSVDTMPLNCGCGSMASETTTPGASKSTWQCDSSATSLLGASEGSEERSASEQARCCSNTGLFGLVEVQAGRIRGELSGDVSDEESVPLSNFLSISATTLSSLRDASPWPSSLRKKWLMSSSTSEAVTSS